MDEYKRKVDSIRAPEALITATLNRIHEEERKQNTASSQQPVVVKKFKPRRKWAGISAISAISTIAVAAVLVFVVGLNRDTPETKLTYGTIPDTIVRSSFPMPNTQQMDLEEYSDLIDMDVESFIPGEDIINSDIQVIMEKDVILSDECTLTYNAEGKPLMLRISATKDIFPEGLTEVAPSAVDGLTVYVAVSESRRSRMAGFRQDDISFFLMGTNMEREQFEALLKELIQNI